MAGLNFKLRGKAKAVLGFVDILATTSKKDFEGNPEWWSIRAQILGKDMARDPQRGLENRLEGRSN